jgi:hypothetical protein
LNVKSRVFLLAPICSIAGLVPGGPIGVFDREGAAP